MTFAFVRNAFLVPYSRLVRPRFVVFAWMPVEVSVATHTQLGGVGCGPFVGVENGHRISRDLQEDVNGSPEVFRHKRDGWNAHSPALEWALTILRTSHNKRLPPLWTHPPLVFPTLTRQLRFLQVTANHTPGPRVSRKNARMPDSRLGNRRVSGSCR